MESRVRAEHGVHGARTGSLTVLQRVGSAFNLNVHAHVLVLDGGYAPAHSGDGLAFHRVPPPSTEEIEGLVVEVGEA